MAGSFSLLLRLQVVMLRFAVISLLFATVPAAAIPADELDNSRTMTTAEMAEAVDFIVGNAVFSLLHAAGHMAADRMGLPEGGERGADDFAALTLLEPRSAAGDQTLVNAIDTWYLSARLTASADGTLVPIDAHALDLDRANGVTCRMVGADPEGFADIAEAVALAPAARQRCAADYRSARAVFDAAMAPMRAGDGAKSPVARSRVKVVYDTAPETLSLEATVLADNRVLEEAGERLAEQYRLPEGLTIRAQTCGLPTTRWDAAKTELVLCYELSALHSALIIGDIQAR